MNVQLDLPHELEALLTPNPERNVLESVLLRLVRSEKISVARAGEILGLTRTEAINWYSSQGYPFPEFDAADWEDELNTIKSLRR
jgi:predicted HTH domain antitoxin